MLALASSRGRRGTGYGDVHDEFGPPVCCVSGCCDEHLPKGRELVLLQSPTIEPDTLGNLATVVDVSAHFTSDVCVDCDFAGEGSRVPREVLGEFLQSIQLRLGTHDQCSGLKAEV